MEKFSELTLHAALANNLKRHGFETPTPVQAQSIVPAMEGKDVVATAQTGTGKTLAFALPVLQKLSNSNGNGPIRAIVLSPTRELAIQIEETFQKLTAGTPIRTAVVVGGMSELKQLRLLKRGVQIVIATPGRLCDFLDRRLVRLDQVATVVLDEADRMLDMGFLPSIQEILSSTPEARQTLLFSATIEKSVAHLIQNYVKDPVRIAIGATTKPAEFVDLHHYEVSGTDKLALLSHLLRQDEGSFLVFARTKHGADRLADQLTMAGFGSTRIHGNRTQAQRNQALSGFKRGDYRVLVATDVAARGIHVDGIAHVVNYDLPQVPEDFIHRVGRTGRAGSRGVASTFSTKGERGEIRRIERSMEVHLERQELPKLKPVDMRPNKKLGNAAMEAAAAPEEREEQVQEVLAAEAPKKKKAVKPLWNQPLAPAKFQKKEKFADASFPNTKFNSPDRNAERQEAQRPFRSEEFREELLATEESFRKTKKAPRETEPRDVETFAARNFELKKVMHARSVEKEAERGANRKFESKKKPFGQSASFGKFGKPTSGFSKGPGSRSESDRPEFGKSPFAKANAGPQKFGPSKFGPSKFGSSKFGPAKAGPGKFGESKFGEPKFGEAKFGKSSFAKPGFGKPSFGKTAGSKSSGRPEGPGGDRGPRKGGFGKFEGGAKPFGRSKSGGFGKKPKFAYA